MIERVASQLTSFGPYGENHKVLLACSGGADSTFLAYAYKHTAQNHSLPSAIIAVVDHAQCAASAQNTTLIADRYRQLGFEVLTQRIQVQQGLSENELRNHRYQALCQIAESVGATQIFVAHHADDQAETVLQRIMRGTGLNGLVGMHPRRALAEKFELCRPLLALRSFEMKEYLVKNNIKWHEDASNSDVNYATRNKIRHEIMPQLAEISTGDPVKALLKLSSDAASWQEAQQQLLADAGNFAALPSYLRQQLIRQELLTAKEKVTRQRLQDLEGALLKKGSAVINTSLRFSTSGGKLSVVARR